MSAAVEELADAFLRSECAVPLLGSGAPPPDTLARRDGGRPPMLRDELRYSTPDLLAVERRVVDAAVNGKTGEVGMADGEAVRVALVRRSFLTLVEGRMVHVAPNGSGWSTLMCRPSGPSLGA